MTLIKSISGIRGTIGGKEGENLTPFDIVKFSAAFGVWVKENDQLHSNSLGRIKMLVGRDARISGEMVNYLVIGALTGLGIDVIDLGFATTPTVEIAVTEENAAGGIILTASHNPKNWNALKLLNHKGEFLSDEDGKKVLSIAETSNIDFAEVDNIGKITNNNTYTEKHIEKILELPLVDVDVIKSANFKIVVDAVNSVGGIAIPALLKALGVDQVIELYCTPTGEFPHNPEPVPEHLKDIVTEIEKHNAHLGFVVDPDVDRLAIVNEDGSMFGEEYTLVAVSDYILQHNKGNTVSNLSSTRALADVTQTYGGEYLPSAVGEVNVVVKMKECNAVIGGEGNGGIIYPELHYGRDALVGVALFLTHLAKSNMKCSELRASYPNYFISKNKIELSSTTDVEEILLSIKNKYSEQKTNNVDGVRIDFEKEWVHLRKSNTEPIIRIIAESDTLENAEKLAKTIIQDIVKINN